MTLIKYELDQVPKYVCVTTQQNPFDLECVANCNELILLLILRVADELKVSKSQKKFILKLHCTKNEQNFRQNFAQ